MDLPGDEEDWVQEHPVYCPVPWCSAHALRHARCGDTDGPYEGIHIGRIRRVRTAARRTQRRLVAWQAAGLSVEDAILVEGVTVMLQDAEDRGLVQPVKRRCKKIR